MNAVTIAVDLAYLLAAAGFVVALHLMNSPATARKGSRLSWLGMIVAVAAALTSVIHDATITTTGWIVLSAGGVGGMAAGLVMARRVKMTDVPQVVSIFNAVGGQGAGRQLRDIGPAGTRAGSTVTVWIDASGAITRPPPDHRIIETQGYGRDGGRAACRQATGTPAAFYICLRL